MADPFHPTFRITVGISDQEALRHRRIRTAVEVEKLRQQEAYGIPLQLDRMYDGHEQTVVEYVPVGICYPE